MTEPIMVDADGSADGNRVKMLLGVAVGILVLAVIVPKLFFGGGGGGDEFDDQLAVPVAPGAAPVPVAPSQEEPLVETTREFSSRNPFAALVSSSSGGASEPAEPAAPPIVPQPAPTPEPPPAYGVEDPPTFFLPPIVEVPVTEPAPTPAPAPAPAPAPTTTAPPRVTKRFALLEVFTDASGQAMARVRIDDDVHEVTVGQTFADSYRLLSLDLGRRCGQFLFGDDRFSLCEGEETRT